MQQTCHTILLFSNDAAHVEQARRAAADCDLDCELYCIADAEAALAWLHDVHPATLPCLVLMDLQLPKLEGWAVLRRLRLNPVTGDLPVLVYSALHKQADVLLSYQAGANSFVAKPDDAAQFSELYISQLPYWLGTVRGSAQHAAC